MSVLVLVPNENKGYGWTLLPESSQRLPSPVSGPGRVPLAQTLPKDGLLPQLPGSCSAPSLCSSYVAALRALCGSLPRNSQEIMGPRDDPTK